MPSGYRCILIAVVGWLSLAAQAPNPRANPQRAEAAKAIADTSINVAAVDYEAAERAHRAEYEAQCYPRKEIRNSDLCAQWKAADAAAKAAKWTKWQTWVGGVSGLLVIVAISLAFQSNSIARDTGKRQLRAYVGWRTLDLDLHKNAKGELVDCQVLAIWKNHGQTPATGLNDRIQWTRIAGPLPEDFDFFEGGPEGPCDSLVLAPGAEFRSVSSQKLLRADFFSAARSKSRIFVWGSVGYTDAFGQKRRTEVAAEMLISPLQSGGYAVSFNAIPQHNGMDGDCMRPPKK